MASNPEQTRAVMAAVTAFFLNNISAAAGQSVGDLADRWISGACKLKAVRGLAGVQERRFAVVSVGS